MKNATDAVTVTTISLTVGLVIVMPKERKLLPAKDHLVLVIKMEIVFAKNSSRGKSVVRAFIKVISIRLDFMIHVLNFTILAWFAAKN